MRHMSKCLPLVQLCLNEHKMYFKRKKGVIRLKTICKKQETS